MRKAGTIAKGGWLAALMLAATAFVADAPAAEPGSAAASTQTAALRDLSEQDRKDVARIQDYLNGISTVRAGFVQEAPDGSVAQGKIYLSRPGKLRVEYDPPVPILMIATGIWLIYYDGELEQATYLPLRSTPLAFLLKDNISLETDVNVADLERRAGLLRLTVTEADDAGGSKGVVTLTFSDTPLELKAWVLRDAQGQSTRLALLDPRFGVEIPAERFYFVAPSQPEPTFR